MKYKLIDAELVPITLYMVPVTKGNLVTYNHYLRLEPGKIYETDDEAQIDYLKNKVTTVKYSKDLEDALEGTDYEIKMCRSCSGRIKKIAYHPIEEVE